MNMNMRDAEMISIVIGVMGTPFYEVDSRDAVYNIETAIHNIGCDVSFFYGRMSMKRF